MFGQERAINAIAFGADIAREGYNLFVLGEPGSGKRSLVRQLLEQRAASEPPPSDWVYVYNFAEPYKPNAIELPAGQGVRFRDALSQMVEELRTALPAIFEGEEYRVRRHAIDEKSRTASRRHLRFWKSAPSKNPFAWFAHPPGLRWCRCVTTN